MKFNNLKMIMHIQKLPVLLATILSLMGSALSAQSNWTVNPFDYQYTMTGICVALIDCSESFDTTDVVAAFIDGEVRGVQKLDIEVGGRKYAFITIYDNDFSGNEVTFKIYDATAGVEIDALDTIAFLENGKFGDVDDPFEIRTDISIHKFLLSNDIVQPQSMAGDTLTAIVAIDDNQDTVDVTYEFVNDSQGTDNSFFSISGNHLVLNTDASLIAKDSLLVHLKGSSVNMCTADAFLVLKVAGTTDAYNLAGADSDPLHIFPSPATQIMHFHSTKPIESLRIYAMNGNLMFAATDLPATGSVDVSDWAPQLYWVCWQAGGMAKTKMMTVQR